MTVAESITRKLIDHNYHISFAETITGGGIAKRVIEVPGSSRVIDFSVIVYSNESKSRFLNVKSETMEKYGAVSEQTVREMAEGIAAVSRSDVSLAVSGIAGPSGATADKPIGMMCFALKIGNDMSTTTCLINGLSRTEIIENTIERALEIINSCI